MTATNETQLTFASMVGEVKWENRDVPVSELPSPVGKEPSESFIESVRVAGIMDPIPLAVNKNGRYELIGGNRRLRAAIEVGLETIPARVIPAGEMSLAILSLVSNEQRSSNPVVELWSINTLLADGAMSESELARASGMSVPTIRKRLSLRALAPEFMTVLELGELAPSMAERIAKLSPEDQNALLDRWNTNAGRLTTEDIRQVREASRPKIETAGLPGMPMPEPAWAARGFGGIIEALEDARDYIDTNAATIDAVEVMQFIDAIRSQVEAVAADKTKWA